MLSTIAALWLGKCLAAVRSWLRVSYLYWARRGRRRGSSVAISSDCEGCASAEHGPRAAGGGTRRTKDCVMSIRASELPGPPVAQSPPRYRWRTRKAEKLKTSSERRVCPADRDSSRGRQAEFRVGRLTRRGSLLLAIVFLPPRGTQPPH